MNVVFIIMGILTALCFGVCVAAYLSVAFSHRSPEVRRRRITPVFSVFQVALIAPSALHVFVNATSITIQCLKMHICPPDLIGSTLCLLCAGAMSVTIYEISRIRDDKMLMELSSYTLVLNTLLIIESVITITIAVC